VKAVREVLRGIPSGFPGSILVVIHVSPESPGLLGSILQAASALPVAIATEGVRPRPGTVWVAPPDRHLVAEDGYLRVPRGPKENRHRPAIDVTMRSAAVSHGSRAVGVVLTGLLDDGSAGLAAIKRAGGVAIVQDPADAEYPPMPRNALRTVAVDAVLPLSEIPARLVALAAREAGVAAGTDAKAVEEVAIAEMSEKEMRSEDREGTPAVYACPDCSGTLWEVRDGEMLRFRCRVGHAYSEESMVTAQNAVEDALWVALRTMEERASLSRRLLQEAHGRNANRVARIHEETRARGEVTDGTRTGG
jgi:two-component system chemotaxis response regulator CheB